MQLKIQQHDPILNNHYPEIQNYYNSEPTYTPDSICWRTMERLKFSFTISFSIVSYNCVLGSDVSSIFLWPKKQQVFSFTGILLIKVNDLSLITYYHTLKVNNYMTCAYNNLWPLLIKYY